MSEDDKLIETVRVALKSEWEYSDAALKARVTQIELLREPLLTLRCKLQKELAIARENMRTPNYKPEKDEPRLTDLDRRTMMEANTAEIQEKYELARGLENLVAERVGLIKILLETQ